MYPSGFSRPDPSNERGGVFRLLNHYNLNELSVLGPEERKTLSSKCLNGKAGEGAPAPHRQELNIQILHIQRILFDKLPSRFDIFAHEGGEDGFALRKVFEFHRKKSAALGVHGGFPELRGGHFAETFVALHVVALAAFLFHVLEEFARIVLFYGRSFSLALDRGFLFAR